MYSTSGIDIFFLIHNIKIFFKKINIKDDSIRFSKQYVPIWDKQPPFVKTICCGISDKINSQHITVTDLKLFVFDHFLYNEKLFDWHFLKIDNILETKKLYSAERYNIDKIFFADLMERLKPTNLIERLNDKTKTIFIQNSEGTNEIYGLVINRFVGPRFFAMMYKNQVFSLDESKYDKHMKRFMRSIQQIIKIIAK